MAFSITCIVVLMTTAMTRSAMIAPAASLSVKRGHLARVICDVKEPGSHMVLEMETHLCSDTQAAIVKAGVNPESRRQDASKAVAVHGFIDTNVNVKRSFLEISFLEILHVEITPNCICKFVGVKAAASDDATNSRNVTPDRFLQAVDIFRCDLHLETTANDIYMEIVESNGEHESFVGPNKTSINDVDKGMQQFNGLKDERAGRKTNITVFLRTNDSLIVAQPAGRFSSSTKYFCRVTRNKETQRVEITHSCLPDNDATQMHLEQKVVDEERSLVWLGYPVLTILLLVVTGLYIRERRLRRRVNQNRGGILLGMDDRLEPAADIR